MLDLKFIRENLESVKQGVEHKNVAIDWDLLIEQEGQRRKLTSEIDILKAERNKTSTSISHRKKKGEDVTQAILDTRKLGEQIKVLSSDFTQIDESLKKILLQIPNLPHSSVPIGKNETANQVIKHGGTKPEIEFKMKDHLEIGERLKLFDFKRGAKISGRGFPIYIGMGARLERALIQFFLDQHTDKNGFTEIIPPLLVNRASMIGTGQLPKMEDDMYHATEDDLFLIPTAEVPVTNMHADEWLDIKDLPISYAAYTPCFRREAGSWGKDTRGFQRLHQFDKVEMVKFVSAKDSYQVLDELVGYAENIIKALGLHYRILELCTGDLSFAAAKCYDLEVYSPATGMWLEVSSVSNFETFQARRANIRTKVQGKPQFVHTLNGSGLATPRILVALLETFQTEEGNVMIPEVLQPYMRNTKELKP